MNALVSAPWFSALGWALLHFLWEGTLVVFVAAFALRLLRHGNASLRHGVAILALVVMAALPVWRFTQTISPAEVITTAAKAEPGQILQANRIPETPVPSSSLRTRMVAVMERTMPRLVLLWMVGALAFALRLAGGWALLQQMRWRKAELAADILQGRLLALCRKAGMRRAVTLLTTEGLVGPSVVGFLRPAIMVPAGWFLNLPPEQVEALLAHELAHVLRHDYLVNLLQSILEVIFFYHPGVWWLSRRIRMERELACDDFASRLLGDPIPLAEALAHLERRGLSARNSLEPALAAHGGSLMQRIQQLLLPPSHTSSASRICALAILALGCAAGFRLMAQAESRPIPQDPKYITLRVPKVVGQPAIRTKNGVETAVLGLNTGSTELNLSRTNSLDESGKQIPFSWRVSIHAENIPLYQVWAEFEKLMDAKEAYSTVEANSHRDDRIEGPKVSVNIKAANPSILQTILEQMAKDSGVEPYKKSQNPVSGLSSVRKLTLEDGTTLYSIHALQVSHSTLARLLETARKEEVLKDVKNRTMTFKRDTDTGPGPKVDAVFENLTLAELERRVEALKQGIR